MHLLGRQISMDLNHLDGTSTPLVYINDWDFNWQGMYTLTGQIPFKPGDRVVVTSIFDNSDNNPKNPNNPIVPVSWGEGTNDEMVVGYVGVILDNEGLARLLFETARKNIHITASAKRKRKR